MGLKLSLIAKFAHSQRLPPMYDWLASGSLFRALLATILSACAHRS
jgi:hypothetical protein